MIIYYCIYYIYIYINITYYEENTKTRKIRKKENLQINIEIISYIICLDDFVYIIILDELNEKKRKEFEIS